MPDSTQPIAPPANTRRDFLKHTAAGAALGALALPRGAHADAAGGETLKLGLVGCGGRGMGAVVDALKADKNVELAAVGDAFGDRAELALKQLRTAADIKDRIKVAPDAVFAGLDSYRQVIDSGVDVVILATPPNFRPLHLAYAVDKGKHCFVEKPIAVDIPGTIDVEKTCELARSKGLSIFSGLVWRVDEGINETITRIRDGAIGDIVAIQSCYNSGTLWHRGDKPSWSRMEYQLRNWLYFTWLSGDIITEQAIHSLDKVCWVLGDPSPATAVGMGGRQQRIGKEFGNVWDHFAVTYDFPGGVKCFFTCRQQDGVANFVDEIVLGTKGRAQLIARRIEGPNAWEYKGPSGIPYQREWELLLGAIRRGERIDHGQYMNNSTRVAIMGRMAGYTGEELTWDKLMASDRKLGPATFAWSDEPPECKVAIPGKA